MGPLYWLPRIAYQIRPMITNPPNTAIDQFMDTAVTGIAGGKNEKKTEIVRNTAEKMLTANPALPSVHGPHLTSSFFIRLMIRSMIGMR